MRENATELMSLQLPCDADAPGQARHALSELECLGWIAGDIMLVASELVTNAVLHSGCRPEDDLAVSAEQRAGRITISVRDPGLSPGGAQATPGPGFQTGGWGLRIVDQLADRWGHERDGGNCVWAEVRLPPNGIEAR